MANPLSVAAKGKGFLPMIARAGSIARRYGITAGKMDSSLCSLTEILNEFHCQATLPTTASALKQSLAVARKVQAQGIELAVHGYHHVDYSMLSLEQQRDHLKRAREIFLQAGLPARGFRAPYLRWNCDTMQAVAESGFEYDSSQALTWNVTGVAPSDGYHHVLEFYGALPADRYLSLPRMENGLVRIPYSLPDDEALVERLKLEECAAMAEIWLAILDKVYAEGGLFTLGLHPERVSFCDDALRPLLAKARWLTPHVWVARLDEIAAWYRELGTASFEKTALTGGRVRLQVHGPGNAVLLGRGVDAQAPVVAWKLGIKQIIGNEATFCCERAPWIGLPPDSPQSLQAFLRHQGFLAEISTDPSAFSYYFSQTTFRPEDERPLLTQLEEDTRPLVRLGRWPCGAQAALSVTGDVDAFTLWDYASRFLGS